MTHNARKLIIETLSMRVFEIQDVRERLRLEEEALKARIRELDAPIRAHRIIDVNAESEVLLRQVSEAW